MLAKVTNTACENCGDTRRVWSSFIGKKIRCPRCTKPKPSPYGMQMLIDSERRRLAAEREQRAIDTLPVRQITGIAWTVSKLYEWGRFVRDRGIGYPPMAATENARIGRGGGQDVVTKFPPDLEVIDQAVCAAPTDYKVILVEHYTKSGFATEKAGRLRISRQTYYQRKARAEQHIANTLGV